MKLISSTKIIPNSLHNLVIGINRHGWKKIQWNMSQVLKCVDIIPTKKFTDINKYFKSV